MRFWAENGEKREQLRSILWFRWFLGGKNKLLRLRFRVEGANCDGWVVTLGILRCAQNDGKDLSPYERGQKQKQQQRTRAYGGSDSIHPTPSRSARWMGHPEIGGCWWRTSNGNCNCNCNCNGDLRRQIPFGDDNKKKKQWVSCFRVLSLS